MTETYGPAVACAWREEWDALEPHEQAAKRSRQGVPYIVEEAVEVADPETGLAVPQDGTTIGEIRFRGNIVMKGYLKDEAATEAAFAGGWFRSGDLAVRHPDGHIQIKDRLKDIIISGGENISSIEIEDAIHHHPAVAAVAVVGRADDKWGEVPIAYVELSDGAARPSEDDIIAFARERLARFKCPKQVIFQPLPRTSTGKIQKRLAARGCGRQAMTHAPQPAVLVTRANGVATLTLNRPAQYNALSGDLLATLQAELDALAAEPDLRCVVLAGGRKGLLRRARPARDVDHRRGGRSPRAVRALQRGDDEPARTAGAGDRQGTGRRGGRRLPARRRLRSRRRGRERPLCRLGHQSRAVLLDAGGGALAHHAPPRPPSTCS